VVRNPAGGDAWSRKTAVSESNAACMLNRLYVGNLSGDVTANTLQESFEEHGFVMDVKVVAATDASQRLAFGLVTMPTDAAALAAIGALDGASLRRGVIKVEMAPTGSTEPSGRPGVQP
jgi:RNA recognition motif-containing protein